MTMNTRGARETAINGHRNAATMGHRQAELHRLLPTTPIDVNE